MYLSVYKIDLNHINQKLEIFKILSLFRMQKSIYFFILLMTVAFASTGQYYEGPYDPVKIHYKTPGFISINEITYGDGLGAAEARYSASFVSVTTVFGYYVSQNFTFGAGTGAYFYNDGTLIPVFADIRFTYNFKKINPYIFADAGFLVNLDDPGGTTKLFMNPGAGARFVLTYSLAATVGIGGHIQEGGGNDDRDAFITYKVGLLFKPRRK